MSIDDTLCLSEANSSQIPIRGGGNIPSGFLSVLVVAKLEAAPKQQPDGQGASTSKAPTVAAPSLTGSFGVRGDDFREESQRAHSAITSRRIDYYKVKQGDTLTSIAHTFDLHTSALARANPQLDPNKISIGQLIKIPEGGPQNRPLALERKLEATQHRVESGDTVSAIAKRYNRTIEIIKEANPDLNIEKIRIGETILIPPSITTSATLTTREVSTQNDNRSHRVRAGESFYSIGQIYRIPMQEIEKVNPGIDPKRLQVGQRLNIPAPSEVHSTVGARESSRETIYVIRAGDTFDSISKLFHRPVSEIISANSYLNPHGLKIGQKITIPGDIMLSREERHAQLSEPVLRDRQEIDKALLRSYLGIPYGPRYPKGKDKDIKHLDCQTLVEDFSKAAREVKLTGDRGNKIYARHTKSCGVLSEGHQDLQNIKTGDIVFIGKPYAPAEGGISVFHLGVVCEVKRNADGKVVDCSFVHASGSYNKSRTEYHGPGVVEAESVLQYHQAARSNPNKTHIFFGRIISPVEKFGLLGAVSN